MSKEKIDRWEHRYSQPTQEIVMVEIEKYRQQLLKEIEKKIITKKAGIVEFLFGDGKKGKIRCHTNMAEGYNKAIADVKEIIKERGNAMELRSEK